MELFPPLGETIEGISRELRSRTRSCVDVVQSCLDRIDEWEPRVRAWVHIDREGALFRAKELDAELAAGTWRGPLHGIPVGIKDIIDVAGFPTAAGSELLARQPAVQEDAPLVCRLREAGAIILGKTVTTQFAGFDPAVTRNPWNLDRTSGGSSSGSAAAVACGMCLGAIGTQTGGSITRPAAFCGVAGCKPSFGRVSLRGVIPVAPSLDHAGPLARSVRDLAILLDAVAENGPDDPNRADARSPGFEKALDARGAAPPRIGRLRGPFDELAEPSVRQAIDAALDAFRAAGAEIVEAGLPSAFAGLPHAHRVIMACEAAAYHEGRLAEHPDDYLPAIRSLIDEGLSTAASEYIRCRNHQAELTSEILSSFEGVDVLICAAAPGPAPDRSTTGDPAFNSPWSYTGLPTVSFPIGLSVEGLPLSAQLIGRPRDEARLICGAAWCEGIVRRSTTN